MVSIIIPVKEINDYIRKETLPAIWQQTDQDFEVIILPDKVAKERLARVRIVSTWPKTGPADKRDLGARAARGEILAFLDDDSYPQKNWLTRAKKAFRKGVAGVGGPSLTPPHNNWRQKVSGYVWSTWLGSGGAGTYRCRVDKQQEVDDFPTVNLLVKKVDFEQVGGFSSHFWPGEDTKLCHDLVYKLGKKIVYDPRVVVYHHRREVFLPHLKQISRYALHRGHFARILPTTSLRVGYFMPSLFMGWLIFGGLLLFSKWGWLYWMVIAVYLILLVKTMMGVWEKERNGLITLMIGPAILTTHLVYGWFFVRGLLLSRLKQ